MHPPILTLKRQPGYYPDWRFSIFRPLFFSLERYATIPAYYVDLPRGPDDGAALRANIFDTPVYGSLAAALTARRRWTLLR